MAESSREKFERRYLTVLEAMLRHRWLWSALIVGAILATSVLLTRLHFDTSFTTLLPEDHPQMVTETRSLRTFGALVPIVVLVDDPDLWTDAGIARVRALTDALSNVEHVERVLSITSVAKIRADDEGISVERFIGDGPITPERARALRAEALEDALYRGDVISHDGDTTAIIVEVEYVEGKDDVVAMEGAQGVWRTLEREGYFDADRHPIGEIRLYVAGAPIIAEDLQRLMRKDSMVLSVAPLALLCIVLVLTFRSFRGVAIPLTVVALTVVAAFAFMGAVGWGVSIVSLNLPPLLMVIALADSIHLISAYYEEMAAGRPSPEAAKRAAWAVFIPCLMTSITTADGFASLLVSSILPVQRMGIVATVGILVAFGLTFMLTPLVLASRHEPSARQRRAFESGAMRRLLD
ncbi:MAG: MMPL family transporter, partial [Myxococcales bacterium]|nr:MMPL family transporter [Myxococcales bacterium]